MEEIICSINDFIKKYNFRKETDIFIKSIMITIYIMTREINICYRYLEYVINYVNLNENNLNYMTLFKYIVNDIFKNDKMNFDQAIIYLNNLFKDGYSFHTFNSSLYELIDNYGLSVDVKPWDNRELKIIKDIFKKHNVNDIFGLYNIDGKTPIYVSSSLASSRFYAYSTPTWFRHFVTGGMKPRIGYDKNSFYNRNYFSSLENIKKIMTENGFSKEEWEIVLSFFNKYWDYLGSNKYPTLALIKNNILGFYQDDLLEILPEEDAETYFNRVFLFWGNENHALKKDIKRNNLYLLSYDFDILTKKRGK